MARLQESLCNGLFGEHERAPGISSQGTHQIRCHMAHIGHALLGDVKYGATTWCQRLPLHCLALQAMGPEGAVRAFTPLPQDFIDVLAPLAPLGTDAPDWQRLLRESCLSSMTSGK